VKCISSLLITDYKENIKCELKFKKFSIKRPAMLWRP